MRNITLIIIIIVITFILPSPAFALEDIGRSQITPASPLYFLKSVREMLELKFAGTTQVRAYRQLEFATRRIREVKSLLKTSHEDLIEPALVRYLSHLQELSGAANLSDKTMSAQISGSAVLHMDNLQSIYSQVSDPRARMSIRTTINRLSQWDQWLIDKLNPRQLSDNDAAQIVTASKLSGCRFLSKEASSAALNEVERAVLTERAQKCLTPKL